MLSRKSKDKSIKEGVCGKYVKKDSGAACKLLIDIFKINIFYFNIFSECMDF